MLLYSVFLFLAVQFSKAQLQCQLPCSIPSTDFIAPSTSEEDTVTLARCHAACVETLQLKTDESRLWPWPSVSTSTLEKNCDVFNEVMQCRLGCVTRANDSSITRSQCRSQCQDLCKAESCDDPRFCIDTTSSCDVKCRRSTCGTGCTLYTSSDALSSRDGLMVPPSPLNSPSLNQTESEPEKYLAGVFDIQYGFSETNVSSVNVTTGFVFKLERFGSNDTYYIFHTTLSEPLDLSYFACEGVSVSFAAVNAYGVSDYSPATEICVHGETFPSQVARVYQEWIREDFRPGFFGRAVLNISWERPEGYEHLTHYVFLLLSPKDECGRKGMYSYEINREDTSFLLMAESPDDPPGFALGRGCIYQTALQSHPVLSAGSGAREILQVAEVTDPPAPTLEVQCHRVVNETTGLIGITATFRIITEEEDENSTTVLDLALEAIDHYEARLGVVELLEGNRTQHIDIVFFQSFTVENDTGDNLFFTYDHDPLLNHYYSLRLKAFERVDLFWRRSAWPQSCLVDASPVPPSPISKDTITVAEFELDGTSLFLNLSWEPPTRPYGIIIAYEVRITTLPLGPGKEDDTFILLITDISGNATSVIINESYSAEMTPDLYLQVRYNTLHTIWSSWSTPVVVTRFVVFSSQSVSTSKTQMEFSYTHLDSSLYITPTYSLTTTTLPGGISATPARCGERDTGIPLYAYGIISAGVSLLVLVSIIVLVTMICVGTRRRKPKEISTYGMDTIGAHDANSNDYMPTD